MKEAQPHLVDVSLRLDLLTPGTIKLCVARIVEAEGAGRQGKSRQERPERGKGGTEQLPLTSLLPMPC